MNRHVRGGHKFGGFTLEDSLESDGLNDYQTNQPMGQTAEQVAQRFQINRAAQDRFALSSQQKAAAANSAGIFFRMKLFRLPTSPRSNSSYCN